MCGYNVDPFLGNELVNKFLEDKFLLNSPLLCYVTVEEAVFSMSSEPSNSRTVLCNPFLSNKTVNNSRCFPWSLCRVLIREVNSDASSSQCGSGVEYLHRDPARGRR
jgi:hypothetical protein